MNRTTKQKRKYFHVHGHLTSRKGQPVRFSAPQDVKQAGGKPILGTVEDEVWANPEVNTLAVRHGPKTDWGDYSFFSQLIRWTDGTRSIRLGYWRRRIGENDWHFGGQHTIESNPAEIETLLRRTLDKTEWFRS